MATTSYKSDGLAERAQGMHDLGVAGTGDEDVAHVVVTAVGGIEGTTALQELVEFGPERSEVALALPNCGELGLEERANVAGTVSRLAVDTGGRRRCVRQGR